jgi:succinate dehydrogenase / fumarate reductase membrane anchor subunit
MPTFDYDFVVAWIAVPFNTVLLLLLIATLVYHSQLGVQVVVEDYVHHHGLKIATMMLLTFAHVAVAALAIFAVLRIAFGGAE